MRREKRICLVKTSAEKRYKHRANIAEAFYAQSDADFISKLYISRKEAGETLYWIDLLKESVYLNEDVATSITNDCDELLKLLTSSIKTMKDKHKPRNPSL